MENNRRRGRPPKRHTPKLPFEKIVKIREAIIKATDEYDETERSKAPLAFVDVVEDLSRPVGRFLEAGGDISGGIEVIKKLDLNLSVEEIRNILVQAKFCYEETIECRAAPVVA